MIKLTCVVLQESPDKKLVFEPHSLPMLTPPKPWNTYRSGGYLLTSTPLVRLPFYAFQQKTRLAYAPHQQLYPVLDALNYLGSIPWRVNDKILDLIIQIYNANGSKEMCVPQPPSECPPPRYENTDSKGAIMKCKDIFGHNC